MVIHYKHWVKHTKYAFILIGLLICLNVNVVSAQMLSPNEYNQLYDSAWCEHIAKDFQDNYGGHLIVLLPLLRSGEPAYLGDDKKITGHMINKVYIRGNNQYFYIDYGAQRIMSSKEEVKEHYLDYTTNMLARDVGIYDMNDGEHPPIPMIWRT